MGGVGGYGNMYPGMTDAEAMEEEKNSHAAADAFAAGNLDYQAGRTRQAADRYREVLRLAPQHSFAWANLGNAQRDLGDVDGAITSHRKATKLFPARARHWFNLGVSLYSSRRHLGEALEAFRKALSINNYMASAHYSLGVALVESGDRAEAKGHYEQAVRIEPHTMVGSDE